VLDVPYVPTPRPCRLGKIPDFKKGQHHRRPRRHGGQSKGYDAQNIILLPMRTHAAWHNLFNHLYATNIVQQINEWRHFHGLTMECTRISAPEYEDMSDSDSVRREQIQYRITPTHAESWAYLFQGLAAEEVVFEINTLYLDPDYQISLVR